MLSLTCFTNTCITIQKPAQKFWEQINVNSDYFLINNKVGNGNDFNNEWLSHKNKSAIMLQWCQTGTIPPYLKSFMWQKLKFVRFCWRISSSMFSSQSILCDRWSLYQVKESFWDLTVFRETSWALKTSILNSSFHATLLWQCTALPRQRLCYVNTVNVDGKRRTVKQNIQDYFNIINMYTLGFRNITMNDKTSTWVMVVCLGPHQINLLQYTHYDTEQIWIWNNIKINAQ